MAHTRARGCDVTVAGELLTLLPSRAIWWERRRTLIVADLHIGKEQTFQSFGIPMPSSVLDETLNRLDALLGHFGAERLLVVGDLLHAKRGLTPDVIDRVGAWRVRFAGQVDLVLGNHDRCAAMPESWNMRCIHDALREPPFSFQHEPPGEQCGSDVYTISGHLHPMVRLEGRVDSLLLPCFVIGAQVAVLPAFTPFARGVRMHTDTGRIFAVAAGDVIEVRP